jgi:hypothetical protein
MQHTGVVQRFTGTTSLSLEPFSKHPAVQRIGIVLGTSKFTSQRPPTCKFLALHQVEKPENGLISTVVATFCTPDTSASAKNLQVGWQITRLLGQSP